MKLVGYKCSWVAPENVWLVIGGLIGVLLVGVYPPFAGPDELNHLRRAYQISEGTMVGQRRGDSAGGYLPQELRRSRLGFRSESMTGSSPQDSLFDIPGRAFLDFRNTVPYTPVPYVPQAIALAAGRLFGAAPLVLLDLARLAGLAAALTGVWLAIRITPTAKWLFLALALTPMSIRTMCVVTADTMTNVSAFLLLAICLRLALDPEARPSGGLLAGLFVSALVLALCKQAYLPMLLLFFLCPAHEFGGGKRRAALFVALAVLCVGAQAAWFLATWDLYVPQPLAPDANPSEQVTFILHNPIRYASILLQNLWHYRIDYAGGVFGYGGLVSRPVSMPFAAGLGLLALVSAGRPVALDVRAKALLAVTGVCTAVTVLTMNYLGWNAVGSDTISSVQGRYFIPVLPLVLLLFANGRFRVVPDRWIASLAVILASGSGLALILSTVR